MRIFNESKTQELTDPKQYKSEDGHLKQDFLITYHEAVEGREEIGHYEVEKEYPNGGKDVVWVVDVPGVEGKNAWEEKEEIQIFIKYTNEEKLAKEKTQAINTFKQALSDSDYKILKYLEGSLNDDEYYESVKQRKQWRKNINIIENEITSIEELEKLIKNDFYSKESTFNTIMGKAD